MRAFLVGAFFTLAIVVSLALPAGATIPPGRFGVGDSIMLSSRDELEVDGIPVNAKVGRQFDEGLQVIRWKANHGTLPKRVIVHLGTNGWIDSTACDTLIDEVGPSRRVFLVTIRVPRDWMHPNNDLLRSCAAANDRVHLIRWAMVSGRHPEWFSDDGYHLNTEGQAKYADYLDRTVDAILASLR
jgi:lysophospholipase L1-like esterase